MDDLLNSGGAVGIFIIAAVLIIRETSNVIQRFSKAKDRNEPSSGPFATENGRHLSQEIKKVVDRTGVKVDEIWAWMPDKAEQKVLLAQIADLVSAIKLQTEQIRRLVERSQRSETSEK